MNADAVRTYGPHGVTKRQKKSNCTQLMRSWSEWYLCQVSWKFVKWFYKSLPVRNAWTDELTNRHNTVRVFVLWKKESSTKEQSLVKFWKLLKFYKRGTTKPRSVKVGSRMILWDQRLVQYQSSFSNGTPHAEIMSSTCLIKRHAMVTYDGLGVFRNLPHRL